MPDPKQLPPVELDGEDLPAYCPNPKMPIWSGHPRIFLGVTPQAGQTCPYCGTRYVLRPGAKVHAH